MPSAQHSVSFQGGGIAIQGNYLITADHPNVFEIPLLAALAGILSTRTDNDTGVVTVATGHGITTDDTIDLYTSAGVLIQKDMDVTAVGSTTISIDAGSGSNLPTLNDPVIVGKQKLINAAIDGDAIQGLGINLAVPGGTKGRIIFEESDDTDVAELTLSANSPLIYNVAGGQTNPLTGDPIAKVRVSHAGTASGGNLQIISMEDSTP